MNRIDFSNLGGFRATQKTWDFLQQISLSGFAAIAKLCGNKTIIYGCEIVGPNITDGFISYNGELIFFEGGAYSAGVVVSEAATTMVFEDGNTHPAYFVKKAFCGTPQTFPFSDLKRLNTLQEMWLPGDLKEVDCSAEYIAANFDLGTGLGINERRGWAICDGRNGTKNRGGRVSVGYSLITIDPEDNVWDELYNTIGEVAGEKMHTLTAEEIPELTAVIDTTGYAGISGSANKLVGGSDNPAGPDREFPVNVGGGGAHENRQPFIVTLFIQKL